MNRVKNNVLLAQWMKLPTEEFTGTGELNYGFNHRWHEPNELLFDLSWDWLMPVVKKMMESEKSHEWKAIQSANLEKVNMSDVYKTLVSYITWYNRKNQMN